MKKNFMQPNQSTDGMGSGLAVPSTASSFSRSASYGISFTWQTPGMLGADAKTCYNGFGWLYF
jgi:hypothetical protein